MFVEDNLSLVPGQSAGYQGNNNLGTTDLGYSNAWYGCEVSGRVSHASR